jgi:hypothetical protein
MPAKELFEYAVIRIVPRVEREEFVNAGVILYCAKLRFLKVRFELRQDRVLALDPKADIQLIAENLSSLQRISAGEKDAGPIAALDVPFRFRWLTAIRSTVVQTSRPHPGLCEDPDKALAHLFGQLVANG